MPEITPVPDTRQTGDLLMVDDIRRTVAGRWSPSSWVTLQVQQRISIGQIYFFQSGTSSQGLPKPSKITAPIHNSSAAEKMMKLFSSFEFSADNKTAFCEKLISIVDLPAFVRLEREIEGFRS